MPNQNNSFQSSWNSYKEEVATLRNNYLFIFKPNYSNPSNGHIQIQTWPLHYYFTFLPDVFPTGSPGFTISWWNEVLVLIHWTGSSLPEAVSPLRQRKEGSGLQGGAWSGTTGGATPMAISKYSRLCSLPLAPFFLEIPTCVGWAGGLSWHLLTFTIVKASQ